MWECITLARKRETPGMSEKVPDHPVSHAGAVIPVTITAKR
jgi:hypothetical protein